ncbi:MAG: hypothetical protein CM1200mP30_16170 [Pseudomonadota bacterium]|nr:MAG: hypothetical protein CM1200mP30_16170 [Pseudomonadota bacterium]
MQGTHGNISWNWRYEHPWNAVTHNFIFWKFCCRSLWLFVPSLIKVRFQVDEVVTTLLLNFVMLLLFSLLLEGPLKDPMGLGWPQGAPVLESANYQGISGTEGPCRSDHRYHSCNYDLAVSDTDYTRLRNEGSWF